MSTIENLTAEFGISISPEQQATAELWIFWIFVSAFPLLIVRQAARARGEIKGRILGRVSQQLDQEIPF